VGGEGCESYNGTLSFGGQRSFFTSLGLYRRSPEPGEIWYTSGIPVKIICFHSEGWWFVGGEGCESYNGTLSFGGTNLPRRFRAKREQLQMCSDLLPESQGPNLALTVLCVPYSLDIGRGASRTTAPSRSEVPATSPMCSGSEAGSYSRLIDFGITQL